MILHECPLQGANTSLEDDTRPTHGLQQCFGTSIMTVHGRNGDGTGIVGNFVGIQIVLFVGVVVVGGGVSFFDFRMVVSCHIMLGSLHQYLGHFFGKDRQGLFGFAQFELVNDSIIVIALCHGGSIQTSMAHNDRPQLCTRDCLGCNRAGCFFRARHVLYLFFLHGNFGLDGIWCL